jgi:hypothetical protein
MEGPPPAPSFFSLITCGSSTAGREGFGEEEVSGGGVVEVCGRRWPMLMWPALLLPPFQSQ